VNSESCSTRNLTLILLLIVLFLGSAEPLLAQGSIFGTVTNSDLTTPADGEISFFGFLDDTDEEIRIESCTGANYDNGHWFDDFQNYLTESPGNPYDYYFYNFANGEGFILSDIIPNNSFQQEDITLVLVDWPAQPASLSGRPVSISSIEISWDAVEGLTYHIYRRESSSNGSFFRIDDSLGSLDNPGVSDGIFIDNNVDTGIGYHYLVIARDASGNFGPHSDFIEVISQEPEEPVITCPGDTTIECTASADPAVTGYATATDNIDAEPVISYSDEIINGDCPQEQIINRTWTATDSDENSSSCLQVITISDTTAPTIVCPPDTIVNFGESIEPDNTGTATGEDNCDENPVISYVDLLVDNTITRTWIATDGCGNSAQCDQEIEIKKHAGPVWYISAEGNNDNDGSFSHPFATFRKAMETAASGDTIFVFEGIYSGDGNRDLDPAGKNVVFLSEAGPEVTIIDCGGTKTSPHRGFYFHSGEDSTTEIIGFTIRNGFANNEGGGVRCESSSPSITNSVFKGNESAKGGGIACLTSSSPKIANCTFENNNATQNGGGIYCGSSSPDISNSIFTGNFTNEFGGAIFTVNSAPSIANCYFSDNIAEHLGGAICLQNSSLEIRETDFYSNGSGNIGGAIYSEGSSPIISGSLFARNSAINYGGAVGLEYYSSPLFTNCTLVKNEAKNGGGIYSNLSSPIIENSIIAFGLSGGAIYCHDNDPLPTIRCSNIFNNIGGDWVDAIEDQGSLNDNFSADPLFCDPDTDDYQLAGNSPCLSGNNECGLLIGAFEMGCDIITDMDDDNGKSLPEKFMLSQNYPNPFNPTTTIRYSLPVKSFVTITVYNILGREIRTLVKQSVNAGHHEIAWDGKAENGRLVSSGIYLYRLDAGSFADSRKMLLLK